MPDITAAQLQADLAAIMGAIPGAVVSATINGTSYSGLLGVATTSAAFAQIGEVPSASKQLRISGAALDVSTITERQTTATIAGHVYLVSTADVDPFGGHVLLGLVEVGDGI